MRKVWMMRKEWKMMKMRKMRKSRMMMLILESQLSQMKMTKYPWQKKKKEKKTKQRVDVQETGDLAYRQSVVSHPVSSAIRRITGMLNADQAVNQVFTWRSRPSTENLGLVNCSAVLLPQRLHQCQCQCQCPVVTVP